jgi:hypothetical protein
MTATAWEAGFEKAMDEWMAAQVELEAKTEDKPEAETEAEIEAGTEAKSEVVAEANAEAAQCSDEKSTQETSLKKSELAQAAKQLVDAVAGDNSEKFQKSNFIDLMRRIAAEEVVVENNSLVEVKSAGETTSLKKDASTSLHVAGDNHAQSKDKDKGKGKAVAWDIDFDEDFDDDYDDIYD